MTTATTLLVDKIVKGIQEKKGFDIVTIDLSHIVTAPAQYFVICTANNPQQVDAITESVADTTRIEAKEKPAAVAGRENAEWVAMDYGTVMAHIFVPQARAHYDLEHLWDDAKVCEIPNLD